VGFATTVDKNEMIKSLQPIYYTRNPKICDSLAKKPTKDQTTKVIAEPFSFTDFTERILLDKDFQLVAFKWTIGLASAFVLLVIIFFIFFCSMTYQPPAVYIQNKSR
jgi:hypothetical protein